MRKIYEVGSQIFIITAEKATIKTLVRVCDDEQQAIEHIRRIFHTKLRDRHAKTTYSEEDNSLEFTRFRKHVKIRMERF